MKPKTVKSEVRSLMIKYGAKQVQDALRECLREDRVDEINPLIETLDLSVHVYNSLHGADIRRVNQLIEWITEGHKTTHVLGIGAKGKAEIVTRLRQHGYSEKIEVEV